MFEFCRFITLQKIACIPTIIIIWHITYQLTISHTGVTSLIVRSEKSLLALWYDYDKWTNCSAYCFAKLFVS